VRQHILGVVDNFIHCFAGNLTGFPVYRHKRVAHFLRHRLYITQLRGGQICTGNDIANENITYHQLSV